MADPLDRSRVSAYNSCMATIPQTTRALADINLSDVTFWMQPDAEREACFAKLQREAPVQFFEEMDYPGIPKGPGYWAVTRYADVWHVSRNPQLFSSGRGGSNIGDLPAELGEFFGSMINMDAPRHTKLRLLVNKGFTPRMVAKVEENVRIRARRIVDNICEKGSCDFVDEIAAALPLEIICDMMGIPASDYRRVYELTNTILGVGDPEFASTMEELMAAGMDLFQFAQALGQERLQNPKDDITSSLMHAEVDGERLSTQEFGSFFILLVVAGNETTRNAISHGMKALSDHPDERRKWLADWERVTPLAVEEIVRWATPVIHFRRTATADTQIGSQQVREGDKVVMWYNAANRDPDAFQDPFKFDVSRDPNEHLGFGGGGPHFCLGANLARREIAVMFDELLHRLPDIEVTNPPDMLLSGFIHGIKRMSCRFTPSKPSAS